MSVTITFNVPGSPVAKGRARSTRTGRHYTPEKTVIYENKVGLFATQAMSGRKPFTTAIELYITIVFLHPKSHYRSGKYSRELKPVYQDRIEHIVKPDTDNICKAVKDSCNGIVWRDDSQVYFLLARKIYGAREGVDVTITAAE